MFILYIMFFNVFSHVSLSLSSAVMCVYVFLTRYINYNLLDVLTFFPIWPAAIQKSLRNCDKNMLQITAKCKDQI